MTVRGTEIHTFSGDGVQVDPARSEPGWNALTIEDYRFWLAPLNQHENGFAAGIVPGENAVDTKVYADGPRPRLVIRNTEAWGFQGSLITNMAAFNLKESIDAEIDGATVWDSEIGFRLRAPASVTLKNVVIYDVSYGVRYEDDIPELRVWNTTFGNGVGLPFRAASSTSDGLEVANVLVLGGELPSEAPGPWNRAVDATTFVDAASHDYHLAPEAPVVDAGATLTAVTTDRDGLSRPQGSYHDIGAYELCQSEQCGDSPPPPPDEVCSFSLSSGGRSVKYRGGRVNVRVHLDEGSQRPAAGRLPTFPYGSP